MRHPGLLLSICLFPALSGPAGALPPAEEAPAKAAQALERLDAALEPLRRGAYPENDRRPVAGILAELKIRIAALPKDAPERAAALDALEKTSADAVLLEEAFWRGLPADRPAAALLPAATAEPLKRAAADLSSAFSRLYPGLLPVAASASASATAAAALDGRRGDKATADAARAAAQGRGAASDPRLFYDGGAEKNGDATPLEIGVASGGGPDRYAARGGVFTARPARVSDLTLGPVPLPETASDAKDDPPRPKFVSPRAKAALLAAGGSAPVTGPLALAFAGPEFKDALNAPVEKPKKPASETACREASDGGVLAGLCASKLTAGIAPVAVGVLDAFAEQFGTRGGWISLLAFTALGLLLSVLSGGVGLLVTVIKALCGLAILWAVGSMISRLWEAFKEFGSTTADDPRHWRALRTMGKVGGELLIMVMMAFAGYKLGQKPAAKNAIASMTEALQGQMSKLGIRPAATAPELNAAFNGAAEEKAAGTAAAALEAAEAFEVKPSKWDYFFGRVKAKITKGMSAENIEKQMHNERRSAQIARVLKDNGIEDNPEGRSRLMTLFRKAWSAPKTEELPPNEYGTTEIKPAELPTATLEIAFFRPKSAPSIEVTTIIPKEHPPLK